MMLKVKLLKSVSFVSVLVQSWKSFPSDIYASNNLKGLLSDRTCGKAHKGLRAVDEMG